MTAHGLCSVQISPREPECSRSLSIGKQINNFGISASPSHCPLARTLHEGHRKNLQTRSETGARSPGDWLRHLRRSRSPLTLRFRLHPEGSKSAVAVEVFVNSVDKRGVDSPCSGTRREHHCRVPDRDERDGLRSSALATNKKGGTSETDDGPKFKAPARSRQEPCRFRCHKNSGSSFCLAIHRAKTNNESLRRFRNRTSAGSRDSSRPNRTHRRSARRQIVLA